MSFDFLNEDFLDNDFDTLYLTNEFDIFISTTNNNISATVLPKENTVPPLLISNICFYENSLVHTDQGLIPISQMIPNKHTINNHEIIGISKTISFDKYLICFKSHSLGFNYPKSDTILSKNHKILYNNKLIPAYNFLNGFENVVKIKYNGETLYNILMQKYNTILVNNLVCETLHPNNFIAKMINSNLNDKQKSELITTLNSCIIENNVKKYIKIVNYIHSL